MVTQGQKDEVLKIAIEVEEGAAEIKFNRLRQKLLKLRDEAQGIDRTFKPMGLNFLFFGMALERTFGGILRAGIETFQKIMENTQGVITPITQLTAAFDFLNFTIGDAIATVLEPFVPALLEIIEGVADFIQQNPQIIILAGALAALGVAMFAFGTAATFVMNVLPGLTLGIGGPLALGAVLIALLATSKEMRPVWDKIREIFDIVSPIISYLGKTLVPALEGAFGMLASTINTFLLPPLTLLKSALESIRDFIAQNPLIAGIIGRAGGLALGPLPALSSSLSGGSQNNTTNVGTININYTSTGNTAQDGQALASSIMANMSNFSTTASLIR